MFDYKINIILEDMKITARYYMLRNNIIVHRVSRMDGNAEFEIKPHETFAKTESGETLPYSYFIAKELIRLARAEPEVVHPHFVRGKAFLVRFEK